MGGEGGLIRAEEILSAASAALFCLAILPFDFCFFGFGRCQVSDKMPPADLVTLVRAVNPDNVPGRVCVIVRMGATKLRKHLPALLDVIKQSGQTVTWICDPMHGNTETVSGYKTRRYENVRAEVGAQLWGGIGVVGGASCQQGLVIKP